MPKTIMVVDDEENIRALAEALLGEAGYKVILAVNGGDCLKKLKNQKPDLILMDIMMPGIPVKEVVKKIRNIRIAYFSVVAVSEAEKQALSKQKNVVGYIQKPFDNQDLIKKVREFAGW
jgi:CheY-like chemotaxis protein